MIQLRDAQLITFRQVNKHVFLGKPTQWGFDVATAMRDPKAAIEIPLAPEVSLIAPAPGDSPAAIPLEGVPADGSSATSAPEPTAETIGDGSVRLLRQIVERRTITFERWADDHKFGRSTFFDWKAGRSAGTSLKGKVSDAKPAEIEAAIRADAKALGLYSDPPGKSNSD